MVHGITRAEELAERRRALRSKSTARGHADAVELRVVVAAVLAVAADAALATHSFLKLVAHLVEHWAACMSEKSR
jgi:hypothetical protein